ncbi:LolA-like outer membrane lipoprotein chaperone [Caminibacter sp.]
MRFFLICVLAMFSFAINLPKKFSADFNQTITSDKQTLKYSGKIFYDNGKIVWEYLRPYKKTIWVLDKVYVYEPDLMQVTIIEKKEKNPLLLIKNAKKIGENRYETEYNGIKYVFELYGKKIKYPKKIYFTDKMENRVVIIFTNIKNKTDTKVFKPDFPSDVDVIYQR